MSLVRFGQHLDTDPARLWERLRAGRRAFLVSGGDAARPVGTDQPFASVDAVPRGTVNLEGVVTLQLRMVVQLGWAPSPSLSRRAALDLDKYASFAGATTSVLRGQCPGFVM